MFGEFNRLIDWLKLPTNVLVALSMASGFILFASDGVLTNVSLGAETLGDYAALLDIISGVVFVVALALLMARLGAWASSGVHRSLDTRKRASDNTARLHNLTREEKAIFTDYFVPGTRTQKLRMQNGVVAGLYREGFIFLPVNIAIRSDLFAFNIQPWVWDYLTEHPDCLLIEE